MSDETVPIATLKQDPENRRAHPPRNVEMLTRSLRELGAARSVVVDEDGTILAGNAATEAAVAAGIERVRVIDSDGTELIAVRRRDLTPAEKRSLALYDNRVGELGIWDVEQLSADHDAGLDFAAFWTPEEERELLNIAPEFGPVSADEQGRLDQQQPITCPNCGHEFLKQR